MKILLKLLQLDFVPYGPDLGLLVLRLWLGLAMVWIHGWGKLTGFSKMAAKFPDPLHIGNATSLGLATFAETVCAGLIILGLFTRFAALNLAVTMGLAFGVIHQLTLKPGPNSGELAFVYLAGMVALLVAGPGRFSLDAVVGSRPAASA